MADRIISPSDPFPQQFLKQLAVTYGFSDDEINLAAEEITKNIDELGPLTLDEVGRLEFDSVQVQERIKANERSFGFAAKRAQEQLSDKAKRNHRLGIRLGEDARSIEYHLISYVNPDHSESPLPNTNPAIASAAAEPEILEYIHKEMLGSKIETECDSKSEFGIVHYNSAWFFSPEKSGWTKFLEISWLANYRLGICMPNNALPDYGALKKGFCGFLRGAINVNEKLGLSKHRFVYQPMLDLDGALWLKDRPPEEAPFWEFQGKVYDSFWRKNKQPMPIEEVCAVVEKL